MNIGAKVSLVVIGAFLLFLFTTVGLFWFLNRTPSYNDASELVRVQIINGTSVGKVATQLTERRLIRSELFFRLLARLGGLAGGMKAGSYRLTRGVSSMALIALLKQGQPEEVFRITLPEGWTERQMAIGIEEKGITSSDNFLQAIRDPMLLAEFNIETDSARGYLFPDTYYWPKDFEAKQLVRIMISNFFAKLEGLNINLTPAELQQRVIMASIVEKEYKVAKEASLIASVFQNRLDINMRLESCATVLYVLTEELNRVHPHRIFFEDLEVESPYNTYLNQGLPPAPIANPSLIALQAAFQPAKTDYLFFVVKDSAKGTHTFSRSLRNHQEAKELYLANFLG